jgi:hypothetical protein
MWGYEVAESSLVPAGWGAPKLSDNNTTKKRIEGSETSENHKRHATDKESPVLYVQHRCSPRNPPRHCLGRFGWCVRRQLEQTAKISGNNQRGGHPTRAGDLHRCARCAATAPNLLCPRRQIPVVHLASSWTATCFLASTRYSAKDEPKSRIEKECPIRSWAHLRPSEPPIMIMIMRWTRCGEIQKPWPHRERRFCTP